MKEYYICKVSNFVNSVDCPGLRIVENDIVKYLGQDILTYNGISMDVLCLRQLAFFIIGFMFILVICFVLRKYV